MHNDSELGHLTRALAHDGDVDVHVGVAPRIAATLVRKGISAQKCETIFNGVDLDRFVIPDAGTRSEARHRFGLAEGETVCLFVGRFSSEKRPKVFCELSEQLAGKPDIRFLMVGDGLLMSDLSASYPRVVFAGSKARSEMPLVYAAADLLVITSAVEGLPMTMLEALASGVPVVATNAGDVGAVIRDGTNGYTVPARQPMLLKSLIEDLAQNPDKLARLKEAARPSIASQGLSVSQMCEGYAALLDRLEDVARGGRL
jgi:glycosyltransferase involved in cell wall biosynthesis